MESYNLLGIVLAVQRITMRRERSNHVTTEQWLRFENAHEAIVDRETWEIAQKVRSSKRRPNRMGEQDILSGLIYCHDCGAKLYISRCGGWAEDKYVYICGKYHRHKEECTPHTIKALDLRQIVLMEIQRVTQEANQHREAFLRRAMEKHEAQLTKDMLSQEIELNKARKRLAELDTLFRTAFEQLALKHISDEQFQMLSGGYGQEKQELAFPFRYRRVFKMKSLKPTHFSWSAAFTYKSFNNE